MTKWERIFKSHHPRAKCRARIIGGRGYCFALRLDKEKAVRS